MTCLHGGKPDPHGGCVFGYPGCVCSDEDFAGLRWSLDCDDGNMLCETPEDAVEGGVSRNVWDSALTVKHAIECLLTPHPTIGPSVHVYGYRGDENKPCAERRYTPEEAEAICRAKSPDLWEQEEGNDDE